MDRQVDFDKIQLPPKVKHRVFKCKKCQQLYVNLHDFLEHKRTHEDTNDPVQVLPGPKMNPVVNSGKCNKTDDEISHTTSSSTTPPSLKMKISLKSSSVMFSEELQMQMEKSERIVDSRSTPGRDAEPNSSTCHPTLTRKVIPDAYAVNMTRPCPVCNVNVPAETKLDQHLQLQHPDAVCYRCEECPFLTTNKGILKRHEVFHRTPDVFKCGFCTASFGKITLRQQHLQTVHPGEDLEISLQPVIQRKAALACHPVGYYTNTSKDAGTGGMIDSNVKAKKKRVSMDKAIEYKCRICDNIVPTQHILEKHFKNIHRGEKPYKCNMCWYECVRPECLNNHVKAHSETKSMRGRRKAKDDANITNRSVQSKLLTINGGIQEPTLKPGLVVETNQNELDVSDRSQTNNHFSLNDPVPHADSPEEKCQPYIRRDPMVLLSSSNTVIDNSVVILNQGNSCGLNISAIRMKSVP